RLALAARLGATDTVNSSAGDPLAEITRLTNGSGADVAIEAVGISPTVDLAIRCARKGGAVTLVGNVSPRTDLPLQVVVTRELSIYGSCASCGEYPDCLEALARRVIQVKPLISAIAPLNEGASWFERLYNREPGLLKVLLTPQ